MIVLYKCSLDESKTIRSLLEVSAKGGSCAEHLSILIYDNSPTPQPFISRDWSFGSIEYRHDPSNPGLAAAYNEALAIAQQYQIEWLLLLDQDTSLGMDLLPEIFRNISTPPPQHVCAMVPKLIQNDAVISPQAVGRLRNHSVEISYSGISMEALTALNSGACLRVAAVLEVGGFPLDYWLEYLDHVMFSRLQRGDWKILVLDVTLEHNLSLLNLESEMSAARYSNVLAAEWKFIRETGWGSGSFVHRIRLLKRAVKHAIKLRNKTYALQAFQSAFSREETEHLVQATE